MLPRATSTNTSTAVTVRSVTGPVILDAKMLTPATSVTQLAKPATTLTAAQVVLMSAPHATVELTTTLATPPQASALVTSTTKTRHTAAKSNAMKAAPTAQALENTSAYAVVATTT